MTLHLEALNPDTQEKFPMAILQPGQNPGSLSQNLPDGGRAIYMFGCAKDNSYSFIQKSVAGLDIEISEYRIIAPLGLESVAELKADESYTLTLLTDIGSIRGMVQFTHRIP